MKKKYSKKQAQQQVNHARRKGRLLRCYQCPCNNWHLTHKI